MVDLHTHVSGMTTTSVTNHCQMALRTPTALAAHSNTVISQHQSHGRTFECLNLPATSTVTHHVATSTKASTKSRWRTESCRSKNSTLARWQRSDASEFDHRSHTLSAQTQQQQPGIMIGGGAFLLKQSPVSEC